MKTTVVLLLGLMAVGFMLRAGDKEAKKIEYTRVDGIRANAVDSDSMVVRKSIVVDKSVIVQTLKRRVTAAITASDDSMIIDLWSKDRTGSATIMLVYSKKAKKFLPSISITQGKSNLSLEFLNNGAPAIITDKTIVDIDRLFGNGIRKRKKKGAKK